MKIYIRQVVAVTAIVVLMLGLTTINARSAALGSLQAVFLNVGQGDSMLMRDVNGFNVLIDGGQAYAGPTVVGYLRQQGVADIDVLVASHPDSDHIGGLIDVLEATDIPIGAVVYNGYPGTSQTWTDFLNAVAARGLTPTVAQFPADYTWGEMTVHVLNPAAGLTDPETNDASIVLLVDHGEVNFLLTGDISSPVEAEVVARGTPMAAEVLKVAHHGSTYSSSGSFLSAVGAQESIIEVGQNSYGHPAADMLERLASAGSAVWRTDRNGNVYVVSDGITYTISADVIWRNVFLPMVMRQTPIPTTVTVIPTTVTPTTVTPTTETPDPTTGNISILSVFYDGTAGSTEPDEFVEIMNVDSHAINVQSWTLRDIANHVYTFPSFNMQPNQVCRVYTNQSHPESCGFNYGSGVAIWNNGGDCAYLRNAQGQEVSNKCY